MKNITKDNKGITLVALIITIIIMLILTSVTVYTGLDTYKFSKVNAFVTQMQLIQTKVDDLVATKTIEELKQLGTEVNFTNTINIAFSNNEIASNDTKSYRYFTKNELLQMFDIEDAYSDVMINFITREIVSTSGVEYERKKYYTQYKLPNGQTLINDSNEPNNRNLLEFNTEVDGEIYNHLNLSIDGLNAIITIENIQITNGTLKYKEKDSEYWINITNYTEREKLYEVNISKSGIYEFRLQDNVNSEKYVETDEDDSVVIKTTNKPKTDLNLTYNYGAGSDEWAYAKKDDINYVWIPRFAYDTNKNIKFIKGNSNITTDNTYIDKDTWTVSEKFKSIQDGTELTGVWVRVDSDKQTGLDMITLLNNVEEFLTEI